MAVHVTLEKYELKIVDVMPWKEKWAISCMLAYWTCKYGFFQLGLQEPLIFFKGLDSLMVFTQILLDKNISKRFFSQQNCIKA